MQTFQSPHARRPTSTKPSRHKACTYVQALRVHHIAPLIFSCPCPADPVACWAIQLLHVDLVGASTGPAQHACEAAPQDVNHA